jgi:hypothetical protein
MELRPRGAGTLPRGSRVIHATVGIALLYVWCLIVSVSVWIPIGDAWLLVMVLGAQIGFARTAMLQSDGSQVVYRGLPGIRFAINRAEVVAAAVRYFGGSLRGKPDGAFVLSSPDGRALLVVRLSAWLEDDLMGLVELLGLASALTRCQSTTKAFDREFPGRRGWTIRHPLGVGLLLGAASIVVMIPGVYLTIVSHL